MTDCLNREQVAEILGITPQSLTNRIARNGPYPPFRIISERQRIWLRSEVEEWFLTCPQRRSPYRRPRLLVRGFA